MVPTVLSSLRMPQIPFNSPHCFYNHFHGELSLFESLIIKPMLLLLQWTSVQMITQVVSFASITSQYRIENSWRNGVNSRVIDTGSHICLQVYTQSYGNFPARIDTMLCNFQLDLDFTRCFLPSLLNFNCWLSSHLNQQSCIRPEHICHLYSEKKTQLSFSTFEICVFRKASCNIFENVN